MRQKFEECQFTVINGNILYLTFRSKCRSIDFISKAAERCPESKLPAQNVRQTELFPLLQFLPFLARFLLIKLVMYVLIPVTFENLPCLRFKIPLAFPLKVALMYSYALATLLCATYITDKFSGLLQRILYFEVSTIKKHTQKLFYWVEKSMSEFQELSRTNVKFVVNRIL